jgi:predicted transcriptional regulator
MVLRRKRGQADAFLYVTGKDIEDEEDYAMNWDAKTTTWAIKGDAKDYAGSDERLAIVELLKRHGPLSIKEMAELLYPDIEVTWDT